MITILIIIAVVALCVAPAIYNHQWMNKAHYHICGRFYGMEYQITEKIMVMMPGLSFGIFIFLKNCNWRAF